MVLASVESARSPVDRATPHALAAYLPRILGDWLTSTPAQTHRAVEGTLVFADISGFTRLTERLARLGRVGAEEMSDALDATFTQLLGEAHADGADLVKWGGDAVLLLFDGPDHAARAARAAFRMRARLRTVGRLTTSAGHARLRMSVGVHSGTFHFFLVGDPALHRELIVCGPDVSTVAEVEAQANAGQIALSPATCALLDPALLGGPAGDVGRLLRREPALPEPVPSVVRHVWPEDVVRGLPVAIRDHLLQGPAEPEHRHIAVGFVAFSDTDRMLAEEGPEATAEALDHCIRTVADAVADHKVTFFETDINRDGGKIMLTAGAPTSAGHDAERMLRAARVIVERAGRLPMRVGVNVGNVFSGDFGPSFRRTYSVKGDAINLAARLVARAEPGQVLATTVVPEQSQTTFALRPLPPFTVKGKARLIHAVDVGPVVREAEVWSRVAGPLVGRGDEVRVLESAVRDARARRGGYLDIVGEAGLGKSRLLDEIRSMAEDLTVLAVTCDEFEASTPYHSVRLLLRDLMGIRPGTDLAAARDRLLARVHANAPHLVEWQPLLGVPLGLDLPENDSTRSLSDEFRKRRVEEVVAEFLHHLLPTPAVILLDDAHFLDSASADLFAHLAQRVPDEPWLVITARREREAGQGWAGPTSPVGTLRLSPLSDGESVRLLQVATEEHPLPRPTIEAIARRAGGNPLFLESLIHAADQAGSVTDLPHSVQDLVTAQVDRLAPADRVVLRYASVLGMRFNTHDLATLVLGHAPAPEQHTYARLREFLVRDSGAMLRFRHALMRDVAYQGLPYRTRQGLHARVGEQLEATNPDDSFELLSLHFLEARRFDKAWRYSTKAARHAAARFANQEAVDLFSPRGGGRAAGSAGHGAGRRPRRGAGGAGGHLVRDRPAGAGRRRLPAGAAPARRGPGVGRTGGGQGGPDRPKAAPAAAVPAPGQPRAAHPRAGAGPVGLLGPVAAGDALRHQSAGAGAGGGGAGLGAPGRGRRRGVGRQAHPGAGLCDAARDLRGRGPRATDAVRRARPPGLYRARRPAAPGRLHQQPRGLRVGPQPVARGRRDVRPCRRDLPPHRRHPGGGARHLQPGRGARPAGPARPGTPAPRRDAADRPRRLRRRAGRAGAARAGPDRLSQR